MSEAGTAVARDVNDASVKAVAIIISVVGPSAFFVLPLLVGALADDLHLNDRQIGFFAATDLAGAAVSCVLALFWVRRLDWRIIAAMALVTLGCANFASLSVNEFAPLLTIRFLAGMAAGALLSLAITVLSDAHHPERGFGYSVAAQVTFQVAGLLVLPHVINVWGIDGVFLLLSGLALSALLLIPRLPAHGRIQNSSSDSRLRLTPATMLAFAGCTLFFINIGCVWTYIERMGVAEGFTAIFIGNGLAAAVAIGIAGALAASWLRDRYGRLRPLALAVAGTVVSVAMLVEGMGAITFVVAVAVYNFVWNFAIPYQYAAISTSDNSGRLIVLVPGFQGAGLSIGPALAASFMSSDNYLAVNYIAAVSVVLSLLLFIPLCRQRIANT